MRRPTITINVQDDEKPKLWVNNELIKVFSPNCFWAGKPLEMAFASIGIFPDLNMPEDLNFDPKQA